ncbi:MAG: hypothetical protein M3478_02865 [Planctomycetota bacterium]|nr:hypothetical protein [Planctomycetota bacterium]
MATPTFVAQKVGDQYILVPKNSPTQRPMWGVAGGLLLLHGFTRRSNLGLVMMVAGAAMTYRGATGLSPWFRFCCDKTTRDGADSHDGGPSYQHPSPRVSQAPADEVEEASMGSFPASDPPAVLRSTGDDDALGSR